MRSFPWLIDEGWPYPDAGPELADPDGEPDEDRLCLTCAGTHLLDRLEPLERQLLTARFGLDGAPRQSLNALRHANGMTRAQVRHAMSDGLAKLRAQLS